VSPTINEEWINENLANTVGSGVYDKSIIRERVEQISVYKKYIPKKYIVVRWKNGEKSIFNI
jgi:hypothetical protein